MKKDFLNLRRSRWLLLTLFALFVGVSPAGAETLTANFDSGLPEGWSLVGNLSRNSDRARTGSGIWTYSSSDNANYVITEEVEGSITFYARPYGKNTNAYVFIYAYDGSALGEQLYVTANMKTSSSTISFSSYTANLGDYKGQVAIALNYAAIDDVTYTQMEVADGPALVVKDGSKVTSPYAYDFGLATAGTTHEFKLTNPGTAAVEGLTVSETGSFGATLSATSIAAGGEAKLTITMPAATGSSTITISSTTEGIADFVINASGTIRDPNKLYEDFSSKSLPEGWYASASNWTYTNEYASCSSWSVGNGNLVTPKIKVNDGDKLFFKYKRNSSSASAYYKVIVKYTTDNNQETTSWTTIQEFSGEYNVWNSAVVDIPSTATYICFDAGKTDIDDVYGLSIPVEPNMVVTQPASLDYGIITEATAKTFTIANTGLATLEGISVTSSNAAFTITGAPTSLAAGASQDVTIMMAATTEGALSSDITVSATGMENVVFTVSGAVLPDGAMVVDFNDNALPTGWTNASWTFANGEATGKSYSAYLTTPKLSFSDGQFIVVKAKRADSDTSDYITIQGSSDGGETWTAYSKKITGSTGLTHPDYAALVISDIPTTVNKLRFVGYYCVVDEIAGLTYAPVLSVTKDAAAVTTPAAYDFGECGTNASVTYNFANAGAGTINITNVAITGDGAAAYSTNWSASVAAPFDLVITRAYDAERGGAAQDAVVTVTTSEGDFVINVTGTDLAADAPTMGVTLGGAAVATGAAADFGTKLKAAPAAKTYTITNTGTGTLTGTISTSDDTKFTVSKTSFSLTASESTTFDLALVFDTSYGDKAATITIHPTVAGLEDVVINATATTMDPETWEEDFEGGVLPTGWIITPGSYSGNTYAWHIGTFSNYENKTNMAIAPTSTTSNSIVTPRLAAKKDDVLSWDAYFNWYDESMIVEWSHDGATEWTTIYNYKPQDESISTQYYHKSMSFIAPADGNYYLRFTSRYSNGVDNFAGFKLNIPDHIMSITTSSIPESSSYSPTMKIGKSFDATVTVKELRGVAETGVVAKLYMGDAVIGTSASTDFEANETKEITISCTPAVVAPSGAQMHIEVVYAGGTLATAEETRYVADLNLLTLDETSADETLTTGTYDVVTLKRTFVAGWNTVCLPNAVTDIEAFFGVGAKAYYFKSYEEGVLGFAETNSMEASYPYIVFVPAAITEDFTLNDLTIDYSNKGAGSFHENSVYLKGTYAPIDAPNMEGKWGVTSEAKIAKGNASASMKGFRAYFEGITAGASARLAFTDEDGTTTVINALELNQNVEGVYNLQGQKVERMQKGLYIVNGRKVVKK